MRQVEHIDLEEPLLDQVTDLADQEQRPRLRLVVGDALHEQLELIREDATPVDTDRHGLTISGVVVVPVGHIDVPDPRIVRIRDDRKGDKIFPLLPDRHVVQSSHDNPLATEEKHVLVSQTRQKKISYIVKNVNNKTKNPLNKGLTNPHSPKPKLR